MLDECDIAVIVPSIKLKILLSVGAKLFHLDTQTQRHEGANRRLSQFFEVARKICQA